MLLRSVNRPRKDSDQNAQAIQRELSVRPVDGGRAYVFSVGQNSNAVEVTLSPQELVLIKHLANHALPWITGWMMNLDHRAFDPSIHYAAQGAAPDEGA